MKNKTGRPKAVINWEEVDKLLIAGCIGTDIAHQFGMHADTLYDNCVRDNKVSFSLYAQRKRSHGDNLLRMVQFDEAVRKRDRGMLIWLGKNRLSQHDKSEIAHKGTFPIEIVNFGDKDITPWKDEKKEK